MAETTANCKGCINDCKGNCGNVCKAISQGAPSQTIESTPTCSTCDTSCALQCSNCTGNCQNGCEGDCQHSCNVGCENEGQDVNQLTLTDVIDAENIKGIFNFLINEAKRRNYVNDYNDDTLKMIAFIAQFGSQGFSYQHFRNLKEKRMQTIEENEYLKLDLEQGNILHPDKVEVLLANASKNEILQSFLLNVLFGREILNQTTYELFIDTDGQLKDKKEIDYIIQKPSPELIIDFKENFPYEIYSSIMAYHISQLGRVGIESKTYVSLIEDRDAIIEILKSDAQNDFYKNIDYINSYDLDDLLYARNHDAGQFEYTINGQKKIQGYLDRQNWLATEVLNSTIYKVQSPISLDNKVFFTKDNYKKVYKINYSNEEKNTIYTPPNLGVNIVDLMNGNYASSIDENLLDLKQIYKETNNIKYKLLLLNLAYGLEGIGQTGRRTSSKNDQPSHGGGVIRHTNNLGEGCEICGHAHSKWPGFYVAYLKTKYNEYFNYLMAHQEKLSEIVDPVLLLNVNHLWEVLTMSNSQYYQYDNHDTQIFYSSFFYGGESINRVAYNFTHGLGIGVGGADIKKYFPFPKEAYLPQAYFHRSLSMNHLAADKYANFMVSFVATFGQDVFKPGKKCYELYNIIKEERYKALYFDQKTRGFDEYLESKAWNSDVVLNKNTPDVPAAPDNLFCHPSQVWWRTRTNNNNNKKEYYLYLEDEVPYREYLNNPALLEFYNYKIFHYPRKPQTELAVRDFNWWKQYNIQKYPSQYTDENNQLYDTPMGYFRDNCFNSKNYLDPIVSILQNPNLLLYPNPKEFKTLDLTNVDNSINKSHLIGLYPGEHIIVKKANKEESYYYYNGKTIGDGIQGVNFNDYFNEIGCIDDLRLMDKPGFYTRQPTGKWEKTDPKNAEGIIPGSNYFAKQIELLGPVYDCRRLETNILSPLPFINQNVLSYKILISEAQADYMWSRTMASSNYLGYSNLFGLRPYGFITIYKKEDNSDKITYFRTYHWDTKYTMNIDEIKDFDYYLNPSLVRPIYYDLLDEMLRFPQNDLQIPERIKSKRVSNKKKLLTDFYYQGGAVSNISTFTGEVLKVLGSPIKESEELYGRGKVSVIFNDKEEEYSLLNYFFNKNSSPNLTMDPIQDLKLYTWVEKDKNGEEIEYQYIQQTDKPVIDFGKNGFNNWNNINYIPYIDQRTIRRLTNWNIDTPDETTWSLYLNVPYIFENTLKNVFANDLGESLDNLIIQSNLNSDANKKATQSWTDLALKLYNQKIGRYDAQT